MPQATKRARKRQLKPWFVLEVWYQTQGGSTVSTRSKPMRTRTEIHELQKRYSETGYRCRILEVIPTRKSALAAEAEPVLLLAPQWMGKKRGKKRGSHD